MKERTESTGTIGSALGRSGSRDGSAQAILRARASSACPRPKFLTTTPATTRSRDSPTWALSTSTAAPPGQPSPTTTTSSSTAAASRSSVGASTLPRELVGIVPRPGHKQLSRNRPGLAGPSANGGTVSIEAVTRTCSGVHREARSQARCQGARWMPEQVRHDDVFLQRSRTSPRCPWEPPGRSASIASD